MKVSKESPKFLGRTDKEKAAIKAWRSVQEELKPSDSLCCTACGNCIIGEYTNPIISFFLDSLKTPSWLLAQTCNGFDEEGNRITEIDCYLHSDQSFSQ